MNFHFVYLRCMFSNKYLMTSYSTFIEEQNLYSRQDESERDRVGGEKAFCINESIFPPSFSLFFGKVKRFSSKEIFLILFLYYHYFLFFRLCNNMLCYNLINYAITFFSSYLFLSLSKETVSTSTDFSGST